VTAAALAFNFLHFQIMGFFGDLDDDDDDDKKAIGKRKLYDLLGDHSDQDCASIFLLQLNDNFDFFILLNFIFFNFHTFNETIFT
jgi:hypothetical protein